MEKAVKNTFLEGIRSDNHPLDIGPQAASDLMNADILSETGDQLILQSRKSNVPIDAINYQETVDNFTFSENGGSHTEYLDSPVNKLSLRCTSAYILERAIYASVTTADGVSRGGTSILNSNYYDFEFPGLQITSVTIWQDDEADVPSWPTQFSVETTTRSEKLVGLDPRNHVLGLKEYSGVAYIVSGRETDIHAKYDDTNWRGTTKPIDDWDRGDENDNRDATDSTSYTVTELEGEFPKFPYERIKIDYYDTWFNQAHTSNQFVEKQIFSASQISYTGKYSINYKIQGEDSGKKSRNHNMTVRFYDGTTLLETVSYPSAEASVITLTGAKQFNLTSGNAFNIEVDHSARHDSDATMKIFAEVIVISTDKTVSSDGADVTGSVECSVEATTKIHADGQITALCDTATGGQSQAEIAIDNNPFEVVELLPGALFGKVYSNMAPGTYTVYFKDAGGDGAITSKVVTVTEKYNLGDLRLKAFVKNFNGVDDFELYLEAHDPSEFTHSYTFGHTEIVSGDTVTKTNPTGNIWTFGVDTIASDTVLIAYVEATINVQGDITATPYKRRCQILIPIEEDLANNNFEVEVGSFPSPDYSSIETSGEMLKVYTPLNNFNGGEFITNDILLRGDTYLDVTIQPSYDRSVNIIWAEKGGIPRIVNTGFAVVDRTKYEIIRRNTENSTNEYSTETIDTLTRLVTAVNGNPELTLTAVNTSGGRMEVGTYKFLVTLATADGNETDVIGETGIVPITHGDKLAGVRAGEPESETSRSVSLKLINAPSAYSYAKLYLVLSTGEEVVNSVAYEVSKQYTINDSGEVTITYTGFEQLLVIDEAVLDERKAYVESISTITQVQNRLFAANIEETGIDYNRLFTAINNVFCTPTEGFDEFKLTGFYNNIHRYLLNETDLEVLSAKIFDIDINSGLYIPNYNSGFKNYAGDVKALLQKEGFHNPLTVEKFTPSWPHETYKYAMCIELNNGVVTDPIPIAGADFSAMPALFLTNKECDTIYSKFKEIEFEGPQWKEGTANINIQGDIEFSFNNMGVVRYPGFRFTNSGYYPMFRFDYKKLVEAYPELFLNAKGFFFVRAERHADILQTGFLIETTPFHSHTGAYDGYTLADYDKYLLNTQITEARSYLPMFDDAFIIGQENRSGGNFVDSLLLKQAASVSPVKSGGSYDYHARAFYSLDTIADLPKAAASFKGSQASINIIDWNSSPNIFESVNNADAIRVYGAGNIAIGYDPFEVAPIFVDYGLSQRNAGGFASKLQYRSAILNAAPTTDGFIQSPTGVFEPYIGLKIKSGSGVTIDTNGYTLLYSNKGGIITTENLKNIYNSDEVTRYVAVTPRLHFENYAGEDEVKVIGTRGDCFISGTFLDVMHGDKTPIGGPQNIRDSARDVDTEEVNSYRAHKNSSMILGTQHSNYLSTGRYPRIVDTVESAEFGSAPSFSPLMSFEQGYLDRDYPFKQQTTQGFNKGFKDNFIGQKFIGVSRNSPYVTRSNENTVLFSNPTDSASFKNGYRDFNVNSYKDIDHSTGGITKIIEWAGNLLSVHSHGINITGVNDQAVLNTQAGQSVKIGTVDVLADKVINVSEEFGSTWLRSVCRSDNFVYGIDANHGKIWATNGQDVKVISMGVNKIFSTFIQDFKGTTEIPGKLYINSYFDPIKSEVIFTLYNSNSDLTYGETIANLDPDMVELFKSMTPEELDTWITEGVDQDEQIERRKQVDTFNYFRAGTIVKHLTLIYAESTGTWTTRLSYSPEFMFSIGSSTYSINNKEQVIDGQRLNGTDHGTLNNRHLIWEHGSAYKDIPIYGSYYGDEPLFELAYCVNAEPENEKILQKIEVIGSESKPTSVEYLTSEDAPWVHRLVDPTGYSYTDWDEIVTEFNSKMLEGTREIVNPARWYTQEIYDRRSAPIFRSNYIYVGGKNEIKVARGIRSMYNFTTDPTSKIPYMVTNMTDKYFHVKLVYNSGEIVYIKEINSLFKTLLNG